MKKKIPVESIREWAKTFLEPADPGIGTWEKVWYSEDDHLLTKLRLMENDSGAWIIVLSCPGGYGANEDHWKGVNLGCAKSIQQIQLIYDVLNFPATLSS